MFVGYCWAFSAMVAVESLMKIKAWNLLNLFEQQLVDFVTQSSNTYDYYGGDQNNAFDYLIKNEGITT